MKVREISLCVNNHFYFNICPFSGSNKLQINLNSIAKQKKKNSLTVFFLEILKNKKKSQIFVAAVQFFKIVLHKNGTNFVGI